MSAAVRGDRRGETAHRRAALGDVFSLIRWRRKGRRDGGVRRGGGGKGQGGQPRPQAGGSSTIFGESDCVFWCIYGYLYTYTQTSMHVCMV